MGSYFAKIPWMGCIENTGSLTPSAFGRVGSAIRVPTRAPMTMRSEPSLPKGGLSSPIRTGLKLACGALLTKPPPPYRGATVGGRR